ncbi:MutT/NUDIX family protein [Streptococcus pseudoporcinus]|uniref:MutT/NUDIX family protein n=1 Tax=Streptococcus pseudoporcinus TaxID=361101 RepID=A0A4U9XK48_9STRE|nr:DNA mismatch repair protein MutT [Streptococcus pseudoporcinus]VTS12878.1 MutT/NUDIX family protein [Streptococcus pseudoporcinus]VUC65896.1 MutT/NUDIX family protein [Streptococcus pseudoporcinus]VUC96820.1 MutT/NUDIX family protein [Streptococcus pseudoporcinus]VUC97211.1 MutT/NUDIX family protein [Streptococcus pseudoporcinus]
MSRETATILTNMCMIYDNQGRVLVQDKVGSNWCGITFPGGDCVIIMTGAYNADKSRI